MMDYFYFLNQATMSIIERITNRLNIIKAFSDSLNARRITTDLMIYNISEELRNMNSVFIHHIFDNPNTSIFSLFQDFINILSDLYEPFENIEFLDEKYNAALKTPYIMLKDINEICNPPNEESEQCYTIFKTVIESKFKPSHPLRQELGI